MPKLHYSFCFCIKHRDVFTLDAKLSSVIMSGTRIKVYVNYALLYCLYKFFLINIFKHKNVVVMEILAASFSFSFCLNKKAIY